MTARAEHDALFNDADYRDALVTHRPLAADVMAQYIDQILASVCNKPDAVVIDACCGTGKFALAIAQAFQDHSLPNHVVGIELAPTLAHVAKRLLGERGHTELSIEIEDIRQYHGPSPSTVVMSEASHLFSLEDLGQVFRQNFKLPDTVFLRTSTHQQLADRSWYKYFPSALVIDIDRHHSAESLYALARHLGYSEFSIQIIDESVEKTSEAVRKMIQDRCFSTLRMIASSEFNAGMDLLNKDIENQKFSWNYEMSLVTFRKS